MKVQDIKDVVKWLSSLKEYIDLNNQTLAATIFSDVVDKDSFNKSLKELQSTIDSLQKSIPTIPDIPEPTDVTPILQALSELENRINEIKPVHTTEVTQVIKEELDISSVLDSFTSNISSVKEEIINLIPVVKDYDDDIKELKEALKKIKDTPQGTLGSTSIHRGASKLGQLGDVDASNAGNGQVLKYNTSTKKWEASADEAGAVDSVNGQTGDVVLDIVGNTFETVSKNLDSSNATLNYTSGDLTSIVYDLGGGDSITKTLNYTSGDLTSVVLSGDTPSGIDLTKTLTYTSGDLTGVAYS